MPRLKKGEMDKQATKLLSQILHSCLKLSTLKDRADGAKEARFCIETDAVRLAALVSIGARPGIREPIQSVMNRVFKDEFAHLGRLHLAVVHFAKHYGPWLPPNGTSEEDAKEYPAGPLNSEPSASGAHPVHSSQLGILAATAAGTVLYDEAVSAYRAGLLPRDTPEDWPAS